jgi:hypothetical protein
MRKGMKYRQWAGLILLLILADVFLLFAKVHNLYAGSHTGGPLYTIYLLIGALLVLSSSACLMLYSAFTSGNMREIPGEQTGSTDAEMSRFEEPDHVSVQQLNENILRRAAEMAEGIAPDDSGTRFGGEVLSRIARELPLVQGLYYSRETGSDTFAVTGEYAYYGEKKPAPFQLGVTLPGQVARNKAILNISNMPENYMTIVSGLGEGTPRDLVIVPVVLEDETIAVIELAFFVSLSRQDEELLKIFSAVLSKNMEISLKKLQNKGI